ncbi:MAG TPA: hypothetical protein DDX71_07950 [Ruminococcus sp.]|nr:hypothetical protein [Ruminococcus sp.]
MLLACCESSNCCEGQTCNSNANACITGLGAGSGGGASLGGCASLGGGGGSLGGGGSSSGGLSSAQLIAVLIENLQAGDREVDLLVIIPGPLCNESLCILIAGSEERLGLQHLNGVVIRNGDRLRVGSALLGELLLRPVHAGGLPADCADIGLAFSLDSTLEGSLEAIDVCEGSALRQLNIELVATIALGSIGDLSGSGHSQTGHCDCASSNACNHVLEFHCYFPPYIGVPTEPARNLYPNYSIIRRKMSIRESNKDQKHKSG